MAIDDVGISKRDILVFVFKWKGTIVGWALFTLLAVTAFSYLLPQVFPATTKVVVERNRAPTLRSSITHDGLESIEVMNNERAIIQSRPVMEAVVDELKPHERPSGDGPISRFIDGTKSALARAGLITALEPRERWVQGLLRSVQADAVVNSNVLEITYADEEPEWSSKIVNAVTKEYIRHHLAVYSSESVTEFLKAQMEAAEAELERLRGEVVAYKKRESVSAVADRRAQLVRELTTAREDLADAKRSRAELLTRFEPGHSAVGLENERIAALRATVDEIQTTLADLERKQSGLEAIETRLASQESTYRELKREYEQARLNAASNANLINVRPVEYAPVPVKPRFPRILVIFLAIPLGIGLSVSIALLREYLDHRVEDPDTAEAALGIPCLGSVPKLGRFSRARPG